MSGQDFEAIPFRPEMFDADWQQRLAVNIRLAGITLAKSKPELCEAFATDPEAMAELFESLSEWSELLTAYQEAAAAAAARILIAGSEVTGRPLPGDVRH